jgi:hypothetical protein
LGHSSVFGKTGERKISFFFGDFKSFFVEDCGSRIAWSGTLMSEDIVICKVKSDFWRDLVGEGFDFLEADNVGVVFFYSWEEAFVHHGADAVDVSGEDFHRREDYRRLNQKITED